MLIYKELRDRATQEDRILDVGTKNGTHLSDVKGEVVAVDLDLNPIVESVQYITANGYDLPFEDSSFDYVICNQVLEHVDEKDQLLDEIRRVIEPTGCFLVSFPNRMFPIDPHGFPLGFPLLPRALACRIAKFLSEDRYEYYRDHAFYLSSFSGRDLLEDRFDFVEYSTLNLLKEYPKTYEGSHLGRLLLTLRPIIAIMTMTTAGKRLFEACFGYASYRCRLSRRTV